MKNMKREAHLIDVHVEDHVTLDETQPVRDGVAATLQTLAVTEAYEVVVVISDDVALHDLNRRFRGVNAPTDVLAFANESRGPFAGLGSQFPRYLGDVVISIDRARAQAEDAGCDLMEELQLLTVHGVLHLLGLDHEAPDEKAEMWAYQEAVLQALGVDISLPE
jgi:probable rRNA maturation factor